MQEDEIERTVTGVGQALHRERPLEFEKRLHRQLQWRANRNEGPQREQCDR